MTQNFYNVFLGLVAFHGMEMDKRFWVLFLSRWDKSSRMRREPQPTNLDCMTPLKKELIVSHDCIGKYFQGKKHVLTVTFASLKYMFYVSLS